MSNEVDMSLIAAIHPNIAIIYSYSAISIKYQAQ